MKNNKEEQIKAPWMRPMMNIEKDMEFNEDGYLEKAPEIEKEIFLVTEKEVANTINPNILDHKSVLAVLLNELKGIDFYQRASLKSGEKINDRHFVIISNEEILNTAKRNYWSLCMSDGFLYVFNGAYWKQLSLSDLKSFLGQAAEKLGVPTYDARYHNFRNDLYKQFVSSAYLPRPERKGNEVLINLKNGTFVISPEKQYLNPFERADFLTYQLQFDYDEKMQASLFQKYLDKVLPDGEQQKVLAEYIGYVFVKQKVLKLEKALVLYGGGANGKSVFFDIINALLGSENICNYTLESLTNSSGYQRAMLSDKLLNYASEISPKMDSTLFKQLVSGEPVEARLPYKEPFLLRDYAKFIFNTNILPKDVEQNVAFFRRFMLINFNVTIPEDERDPMLASKIIENELPGVFNWVLDGLKRLLTNRNFTPSKAIENAISEYRLQSDSVQFFLEEEGYVPDSGHEITLKEFYGNYKQYCGDTGCRACSRKNFAERMRNLKFEIWRKSSGYVIGIVKIVFEQTTFPTSNTLIDTIK